MNLVWFLTVATILSLILGEFGRFPFGESVFAVRVTDILLLFSLSFLAVWQIAIQRKILIPKGFLYLSFFWLIGFISLLFSGNLNGIFYLIRFILYSLSFWLGYSLIISKVTSFEKIIKDFLVVGLILSSIGFLQLIFYPDFKFLEQFGYDPHVNRLASTFLDPNFLGTFLNICFIFSIFLYQKLKDKRIIFLTAIYFLAIIFTYSRSSYLMLLVEILIISFASNKRIIFFLFILGIALFIFIPRVSERVIGGFSLDKSANERIESWQNGLNIFNKNPILGVGFNNLRQEFEKNNQFKVFSSGEGHSGAGIDSSLIFVLATTGILGFLIYISWWVLIIRQNFSKFFILALILGLMINSIFINSLFYPPIMFTYFLILGSISNSSCNSS